jgi:hypothetical protein
MFVIKRNGLTTHKTKYPVLELRGNEPSLIRLGLAYLIAHEISHVEYREDNPISDDEDYTDEFKEIERHNIERIWGIFLESDKELENYS